VQSKLIKERTNMLYVDYDWQVNEHGITLDETITLNQLGWKLDDVFKLVRDDGILRLVKLDPVDKFVRGLGHSNGQSS